MFPPLINPTVVMSDPNLVARCGYSGWRRQTVHSPPATRRTAPVV